MKRLMMAAVAGMAILMAVGCGKSNQDICNDICNQTNKCEQSCGTSQGLPASDIPTENCTTECANANSSSAANSCSNTGAFDSCITGVDTTNGSTCVAALSACQSKC